MKYSISGILFAALLSANGTWADTAYQRSSDLLKHCTSESTFELGVCGGYLAGTADTLDLLEQWKGPTDQVCAPDAVTISQLRELVTKHIKEHPEQRHLSATSLVLSAFYETFPCED